MTKEIETVSTAETTYVVGFRMEKLVDKKNRKWVPSIEGDPIWRTGWSDDIQQVRNELPETINRHVRQREMSGETVRGHAFHIYRMTEVRLTTLEMVE